MRVALVSPYSWSYPGGVTRHIEALAEQLLATGHHVRVLTPHDPPDRLAARLHRGACPQPRRLPDYVVPVGRTVGFPANGAVSNLAITPTAYLGVRHALQDGGFDVVHVHEPVAPVLSWMTTATARLPLVGTFHAYAPSVVSNNVGNLFGARQVMNRLHVRIAVSEAAAWTGRRFFGGRYRIVPNGVHVPERPPAPRAEVDGKLRIVFVGLPVERKGLPVLLRAFEALREQIPAELAIVGADEQDVAPLLLGDRAGIVALGKVPDEEKQRRLREADVLCAPSLGGESFGMVLTEAFAAGTPVVASDIPGYRDVVRDGREGVLFPRGDALALAHALRDLWLDPARRRELGRAAGQRAHRYAWPRVAEEIVGAYEDAIAVPRAASAPRRLALRAGVLPADGGPREPARRLPSLEPAPERSARERVLAGARRAALPAALLLGVALAVVAVRRIGIDSILNALVNSSPTWVLVGLGLMCTAMAVRAVSWRAILAAAMPTRRIALGDALRGTFIGVLMSATLPARLGEPSRALIVSRRIGSPRVTLPIVAGTIVSQALLNILALIMLGIAMFSSVDFFAGHQEALLAVAIAPAALLAAVLLAPALLRHTPAAQRRGRLQSLLGRAGHAVVRVRSGLRVFKHPRLGATAVVAQLAAWGLQWLSCYTLLVALGLDHRAGFGAAAAVLFAVNVTAVIPATPSNLGVFQAACVAVLHGAYHVGAADALGYGIILQAVEVVTALVMGMPALVHEGVSWKDIRLRALHAAPVSLPALPAKLAKRGARTAEAE